MLTCKQKHPSQVLTITNEQSPVKYLTIIGPGWAKDRDLSVGSKTNCQFHKRTVARRRKAWFHLHMSRILFAAKHSWKTLHKSKPLFAGTYLQVTWRAVGQWKGRKLCIPWYCHLINSGSNHHLTSAVHKTNWHHSVSPLSLMQCVCKSFYNFYSLKN